MEPEIINILSVEALLISYAIWTARFSKSRPERDPMVIKNRLFVFSETGIEKKTIAKAQRKSIFFNLINFIFFFKLDKSDTKSDNNKK